MNMGINLLFTSKPSFYLILGTGCFTLGIFLLSWHLPKVQVKLKIGETVSRLLKPGYLVISGIKNSNLLKVALGDFGVNPSSTGPTLVDRLTSVMLAPKGVELHYPLTPASHNPH